MMKNSRQDPSIEPPSGLAGQGRAVARIVVPTAAQHGSAFSARRMGMAAFGREGDPFLNLDHFRMGGPTFPPHPHAGFSAVTYMLPESPGGMRNRDSRGDHSVIPSGGLHWTAAGSGIVHEEVPEHDGLTIEGFQIFVRQPVAQEDAAPVIHHVDPDAVPEVGLNRGFARVLAGRYGDRGAPFDPPSPLALIDVTLVANEPFAWTPEPGITSCAIYLFAGRLATGGREVAAPVLILFEHGQAPVHCTAIEDTRLLVLAGRPLDAPSVSNGPFVLSSQAALDAAVERYRRGAMGALT
ncbi:pirin family protein [Sphingomonas sp. C8-2]|jgi:redox-sensitive bicupin YhaK (pirin superfamily)|nr:pirin family protein [Sphingomonas sp. C8-2]